MSTDATQTPPPLAEEIDAMAEFIHHRLEPMKNPGLRRVLNPDSDESRTVRALSDTVTFIHANAKTAFRQGEPGNAKWPRFHLAKIAQQWNDHPEFRPEWNR
ncbi:hypothetical protein OG937_10665 [Streptomyces sp. NBC_00510]